jgi:hypothetical protein
VIVRLLITMRSSVVSAANNQPTLLDSINKLVAMLFQSFSSTGIDAVKYEQQQQRQQYQKVSSASSNSEMVNIFKIGIERETKKSLQQMQQLIQHRNLLLLLQFWFSSLSLIIPTSTFALNLSEGKKTFIRFVSTSSNISSPSCLLSNGVIEVNSIYLIIQIICDSIFSPSLHVGSSTNLFSNQIWKLLLDLLHLLLGTMSSSEETYSKGTYFFTFKAFPLFAS